MNFSRVALNGFLIFVGIALFFLLMEMVGLSNQIYLRLVNFIFVIWGVNKTIKSNYQDHIYGYFTNLTAGIFTALVSLALGIFSFIAMLNTKARATVVLTNTCKTMLLPIFLAEVSHHCTSLFRH